MSFSIIYFLFSFICLVVWPNKKTFANSYLFFSFHYSSRLFLFFSFRSFLLSCDYLWYQMHLIERISFLFFSLFIYHSLTHFTLSLPLLFFHFYIFVYFFFNSYLFYTLSYFYESNTSCNKQFRYSRVSAPNKPLIYCTLSSNH